ncbi:MAG: endonuclease III domain-containing protein [Candidatus Cloacimonetes bacterium]|jgi:endonuclease-3 related protein|nr:endonuclease III domain-containing protein [Candidatus Cloacimonadota bacterium]MDD4156246.1 endonuclease III domain-containing protein [Candidatus Cloacimonadota bacterium]
MSKYQKLFDKLFNQYGKQDWWPADNYDEIIIGAILTQNTAWTNVEKAIRNLKTANKCDLKSLSNTTENTIAGLIKPSGYFNVKAKRLKTTAKSLVNYNYQEYDIDENRNYLLNIKGIGPETADSILLYAMELPVFVVDSYTIRLLKRIGIQLKDYKYHTIQSDIMKKLSRDVNLFNEYHALIVNHCKFVCKAKPDCINCFLNEYCDQIEI